MIKSTLVYLTQGQLLPMRRTAQIVSDLFGVKLSAGSVHTRVIQAAQTLIASVMQIAAAVIASPVVHFDDAAKRAQRPLASEQLTALRGHSHFKATLPIRCQSGKLNCYKNNIKWLGSYRLSMHILTVHDCGTAV